MNLSIESKIIKLTYNKDREKYHYFKNISYFNEFNYYNINLIKYFKISADVKQRRDR